jgi:gliding motility-associated-like protein
MKLFQTLINTIGLRAALIAILFVPVIGASAQTIDVGPPDTSICSGEPIDLTAVTTGGGGGVPIVTIADFPGSFGVSIYEDDGYSSPVNIGFDFEFFGNIYNQCLISTNSYITFDLAQAGQYSPWGINAPIPNGALDDPTNAIMFPWQDINPNADGDLNTAGIISYVTCGEAPNRVFIVDYFEVKMFSCTDLIFSNQVKLFETSNRIETHIANKPLCAAWNGGAAVHGLEDPTGTVGVVVPGRNFPDNWAVTNDGYEFIPDGGGSYNINPITFEYSPLQSGSLIWTDDQGIIIGNSPTITVNPAVPTMYTCTVELPCGVGVTVSDSILVTIGNADLVADSINTTCVGFDDGGVFIDPTGSVYPAEVSILDAGTLTPIQTMSNVSGPVTLGGIIGSNIPAGNYLAQVIDAVGCESLVNITVNDPPALTFTAVPSDASCFGFGDGEVIVNQDGNALAPLTFIADSGAFAAQITGVNVLDTIQGLYANDYTITMIDANNCPGTPVDVVVGEPTDLVPNAAHIDVLCFGEEISKAWAFPTGSVGPYELLWDDQFAQTTDTALWLGAGTYNVQVTDAQNCVTDTFLVITQPDLLEVVLTGESDTCGQFPSFLRADVTGGLSPYLYDWAHTNNMDEIYIDTLNYYSMDSAVTYGDYSIIVLDSNNCEVTGEINIPLIPGPIAEFLTRSKPQEIIDPYALFDNQSSLAVSYEWHFGDGYESFAEYPEHEYRDTAGTFLVQLIARNDPAYDCWDEAWQYVDVAPYFTFYVPSAFTPDGDGMNDEFGPQGNYFDYETYRMTIHDRWGSEVFKTDNPEFWWDGRNRKTEEQVKDGVYVYLFEIKKFNTFEPKVITGTITVHRQHQAVD